MVAFGQWLIEFLKVIGLGALFGAAVGAGLTRRQKANEALHAIRAANYREIVRAYTDLIIHLEHAQSAAQRMLSTAGALLHVKGLENQHLPDKWVDEIVNEIETGYAEYTRYRDGLPEKLAPIATHHSQSTFFIAVSLSKMSADTLDHSLYMLMHELTAEHLADADKRHDELRKEIRNLNKRWANWKEKEEITASGLPPHPPLRQRAIKTLRGLIPSRTRRKAQSSPSRDETPSVPSSDGGESSIESPRT